MKLVTVALVIAFAVQAGAQEKPTPTLRSVLIDQLRSTHSKTQDFVCFDVAVANLIDQQASWTDGKGNHSVGQLTYHLLFWTRRDLQKLRGEQPAKFNGNNDQTFTDLDPKQWSDTLRQLDQTLTDIEKLLVSADDEQFANSYHIGEIVSEWVVVRHVVETTGRRDSYAAPRAHPMHFGPN